MELTVGTIEIYLRLAGGQMIGVAERLGDERVNQRPPGPDTNSVAALITHCCGVAEFWLGFVGLGRPSTRDRDAEFVAVATVSEIRVMIATMVDQVMADVRALDADARSMENRAVGATLEGGDDSDGALVLHLFEELYQHLGQMELTADALS